MVGGRWGLNECHVVGTWDAHLGEAGRQVHEFGSDGDPAEVVGLRGLHDQCDEFETFLQFGGDAVLVQNGTHAVPG